MPLNKLDNFLKNTEGRILYVNPNDLDSSDSIDNQGNSLARPFKTIQRAILEAARFSYVSGNNNDLVEKTTILLFPGEHVVDNRPGWGIYKYNDTTAYAVPRSGGVGVPAQSVLSLGLDSVFDLTQEDNILYKFNSIHGGVVVPRGTSIVGLDLRKTKIRPKYVPNPTDPNVSKSAIFRITGACYFWQFSLFDADPIDLVYTNPDNFDAVYQSTPTFSHHKLTCFEFCDGVNKVTLSNGVETGITDLDMYYSKVSNAYNAYRSIGEKYPVDPNGFAKRNPEWEIVGAFASDPVRITNIISGNGAVSSVVITVTTEVEHGLNSGTPIKVRGVSVADYNISTTVQNVLSPTSFTYVIPIVPIIPNPSAAGATVTIETDTVSGASPYIFNCSLRSVWGMNGLHADGSKAAGFRSTVVAQFTAVSLQKDDRAFVKYNKESRTYDPSTQPAVSNGADLTSGSSQQNSYHLDSDAIYRRGWESSHIKISNDAFIQIVSVFAIGFTKHFDAETGGDASITNSNSNFGQISLNSSGFKKEAFDKDDRGYITSIITPRSIDETEDVIEWVSIDVGLTTTSKGSTGISSHLYLYGFKSQNDPPSSLTQGYRIGARLNDKLYLTNLSSTYSASIYMCDNVIGVGTTALGTTSSVKTHAVTAGPTSNSFTIGSNKLLTGEKVKIISSNGDLPENIVAHETYYVINNGDNNTIKLASSYTAAIQNQPITVYGGTNLTILSRVSDKESGDLGSPVQFDTNNSNWFIHVNENNEIYNALVSGGVSSFGESTDLAYVKRFSDQRSLEEKIYKIRVVIPKELQNAKDPETGFIIQESSSTGARSSSDFTLPSITSADYNYNRNPRFISTCSVLSTAVTVISELPHDLQIGDLVIIRNVKSSTNSTGEFNIGYNGRFAVTEITDALTFKYSTTDVDGKVHTPGTFTDTTSTRDQNLPRFEKNDWQGNLFIYRNEIISPYIYNKQDGVYHLYVLNASNTVPTEFTNLEYGQLPSDLYPQLDRDNIDSNPPAARTYAKRSPIGEVVTNDLKKSITRETVDLAVKHIGIGLTISTVNSQTGIATITFPRFHGLSGIVTGTRFGGSAYPVSNGTYYNVKLLSSPTGTWNGATAHVTISGGGVQNVQIVSPGSGYSPTGTTLYFDQTRLGFTANPATYTVSATGISTNVGDVVQFTGTGSDLDTYHRITSVPSSTTISIAKTAGDVTITDSHYAFVVGQSVRVVSSTYTSATGITSFTTSLSHGLVRGNRFRVIDSSDNNLGDYLVEDTDNSDVTKFTAVTNKAISAANGYILKHGFSSNEGISDITGENFGARNITFYANDNFRLTSALTTGTTISISSSGIGTAQRLPLGSYIQIDNEIMRITSVTNTSATVIRGSLGTIQENHNINSIIRKIHPIPVEFRRPSIIRASGHTFEYLGYGPGNYSTALPQVQVKTLSEAEEFLSQSQERSCGVVVYTGMNNKGDFYNGNTKTVAASGEVVSYDIPNPTITGENQNKLSVVFDEVTIGERLLVEGGPSGQILSQFDGPVTFNKNVRNKGQATFSGKVKITNTSSDALNVTGGVVVNGELVVNTGVVPDTDEGAYLGTASKPFSDAHIGEVRIAQTDDNTIDTATGSLKLSAPTGSNVAIQTTTTIKGNLDLTTAGSGSDASAGIIKANYLDVPNISPVGSIIMWPGTLTNFPSDWAICNGQQLPIATYTNLYNVLTNNGTAFVFGANTNGSGSPGSTHFRLPNLIERFIVGAGSDNNLEVDGSPYSVGDKGGSRNATLVSHNHPGTTLSASGNHTHSINLSRYDGSYGTTNAGGGEGGLATVSDADSETRGGRVNGEATNNKGEQIGQSRAGDSDGNGRHTHAISIATEGNPATDANLPPYLALIYLIRIQ